MNAANQFQHEYDLEAVTLVSPTGYAFSMWVPPRYAHHYVSNTYEAASARLIQQLVRRADLFIDIGAHCGFYSLLAANANPDLDIVAVEPTPETAQILRRNVQFGRAEKVVVQQAAVSAEKGDIRLFRSAASDNCGAYVHPAAPLIGEFEVRATTVDELVGSRHPKRVVIKIDTEGHELSVLRGMAHTITTVRDVRLLIELNPLMLAAAGSSSNELLDLIDELGFAAFVIDEASGLTARATRSSPVIQRMTGSAYANIYCMRKEDALSVLFFSHSSQLGGAERHLLDLAKALIADYNVTATVVVPDDGPLVHELMLVGAACIVQPKLRWWASPTEWHAQDEDRLLQSAEVLMLELLPTLGELQPDIVFTQTSVIPWGAATAAILGIPHVWSICEFGEADHGFKYAGGLAETLKGIREGASLIVTNSNAVSKALFPDLGPERVQTVYQHIEIPDIGESTSTQQRGPWLRSKAIRLGLFGTLTPSKGQSEAIKALALLDARGCSVELVLAGYGAPEYRTKLEQQCEALGIRDRVHFVGFLPDPFPLMRATDIVLVCSRQEAFGRVAVEAMLLSKPLVYTCSGGLQEFMSDGVTGLGYSVGNIQELSEKIEALCRDADYRCKIAQAGHAEVATKFSSDNFAGKIHRLMTTAISGSAGKVRTPPIAWHAILSALRAHRVVRERNQLLHERDVLQTENEMLVAARRGAQRRADELCEQLSAIQNSSIWRVTLPARVAGHLVKKFIGRL